MNNELNIQELLAELEAYRWRDKKALILERLGGDVFMGGIYREEKIKAYEEQKWITFMKLCYIYDEVDTLLLQGYTFDEIVRAIKEYIAEHLAEEKENE